MQLKMVTFIYIKSVSNKSLEFRSQRNTLFNKASKFKTLNERGRQNGECETAVDE